MWSEVSQDHTLIIHDRFITTDEEFFLFNVYAPCDIRAKHDLWVSLSTRLLRWRGKKVGVRGWGFQCGAQGERKKVDSA